MSARALKRLLSWTLLAVGLLGWTACKNKGTGPGPGNQGGGCPGGPPQALFTIKVTAVDGYVPDDTTVIVKWSAGQEPSFVLSDSDTWLTLDESNLVCEVDSDGGPPTDLAELRCELWTSGTTELTVEATGYSSHEQTLMPATNDKCEHPVPSEHAVELEPAVDAGSGD